MKNIFISLFILCITCCVRQSVTAAPVDTAVGKQIQKFVASDDNLSNAQRPYKDSTYYQNIPVKNASSGTVKNADGLSQKISNHYKGADFNYEENKINRLSWFERVQRRIEQWIRHFMPDWDINLTRTFYYILIGLGAFALIFLIYKLAVSGKGLVQKDEEQADSAAPEWVEKRLETLNLSTFLEKALQEKNFPLAIRYLHLINLKKLAAAGQITWDYQKTNQDFLYELQNKDWEKDFSGTIRIYEYVWYGHFPISGEDFNRYQTLFNHFNQEIR